MGGEGGVSWGEGGLGRKVVVVVARIGALVVGLFKVPMGACREAVKIQNREGGRWL